MSDNPEYTNDQLANISATERKAIEAQMAKAQSMLQDAVNRNSQIEASQKLDAMCEQFREKNGHQPTPWHVENMKRDLRAQGIEIW